MSRADILPQAQIKGFSLALCCMCSCNSAVSRWLMFEGDFTSNSCLCSLIPALLGPKSSLIEYLSGAEKLQRTSMTAVLFRAHHSAWVKDLYREQPAPEKTESVSGGPRWWFKAFSIKTRDVGNHSWEGEKHPLAFGSAGLLSAPGTMYPALFCIYF